MTTYIENGLSAIAEPSSGAVALTNPFNPVAHLDGVVPGLLALWTIPFQAFQIWADSISSVLASHGQAPSFDVAAAQSPAPTIEQTGGQELYA